MPFDSPCTRSALPSLQTDDVQSPIVVFKKFGFRAFGWNDPSDGAASFTIAQRGDVPLGLQMRAALLSLALVLAPHNAPAQVSAEGHFYDTTCNASGFVLTSKHPVGRFFGTGAMTQITDDHETLYLGLSCDAARSGWGAGTWCWANGGFRADFPERSIGFPRQELQCHPSTQHAGFSECRC